MKPLVLLAAFVAILVAVDLGFEEFDIGETIGVSGETNEEPSPEDEPEDTPAPSPAPSPSPEPSPSPSPDETAGADRLSFEVPYPSRCLERVRPPRIGLIAAYRNGRVSIAAPGDAQELTSFSSRPPLAWSPSGRVLATGQGDLFSVRGRSFGTVTTGSEWAWSTVADCLVVADAGGGLALGLPNRSVQLLQGAPVADLSFSPGGAALAWVAEGSGSRREIWVADLRRSVASLVKRFPEGVVSVDLMGWGRANDRLLYGTASGESIRADGVRVRAIDGLGEGRPRGGSLGATVLPYLDSIRRCGPRLLAVVGGGRDTTTNKALAYLEAGRPAQRITPSDAAYVAAACRPGGDFIAAVTQDSGAATGTRRLVLLNADGGFVDNLTADSGSADEYPMWGPPGTGVVFVRRPDAGGAAQVWYIPEGSTARATTLRVASGRPFHGTFGWPRVLDWSGAR